MHNVLFKAVLPGGLILGALTLLTAYKPAELSDREAAKWTKEQEKVIEQGNAIFHDGEKLSTNGVACAMCHPDAANTHAETYPKFQSQLKRVVQLHQMVNWCIENPLEGKALDPDSPEMVALVAYMTAARAGWKLEPGKW